METSVWITKEEPSQFAPCSISNIIYNNGTMFNTNFTDQKSEGYKNCNAQSQQQQENFGVGFCQELDNLGFCLDDFLSPPPGQCEQSFGQTIVKKEEQNEMQPSPVNSDSGFGSLHIRTDGMEQSNGNWLNGQYECATPDSAINTDAAFSPNSDFGRSCNESPRTDLESPQSVTSSNSDQCAWGQNEVGLEIYHDLIMRHLAQDIKATSARLNIPQDPKLWTTSDSRAWLTDMATQYQLTQVPYENFNVDGATLCAMNLSQFTQRFPNGGETVHAQLQIWTSANDYCKRPSNNKDRLVTPPETAQGHFFPTIPGHQQQQDDTMANYSTNGFHTQFSQNQSCTNSGYSLGALLPSPGSCSDSGLSTDYEMHGDASLTGTNSTSNATNIHLWQFLRELLEQPEKYSHCVRWIEQSSGIFKIEDSHKLAKIWGQRKNRPAMNYDKLSRSLRQYYKKGILKKTARSQRLVYQFLHPFHMC